MSAAEIIVAVGTCYLQTGLTVAVPFALFAVDRVESSARGGSLLFRLLIIPGATLLWPLVVTRSARVFIHFLRARARRAEERS